MFLALSSGAETSTLAPIITGMGDIVTVMTQVWSVMTSNPLLVAFLGASLLTVGIRVFRKVKSAAR